MKHKIVAKPASPPAGPVGAPFIGKRERTVREVPTVGVRIAELAQMWHVSRSLIYRAVKNGEIPSIVIAGQIRIPIKMVDQRLADAIAGGGDRKSA
jgi:excisionase family DNA binding protein